MSEINHQDIISKARAVSQTPQETITAMLCALADYGSEAGALVSVKRFEDVAECLLLFMAKERVAAERAAFVSGAGWRDAFCGCDSWSNHKENAELTAAVHYPDAPPSHIDAAIAEHLEDDTGGKAQSSQCAECESTERNPHSASLCRDCQIKQLIGLLHNAQREINTVFAAESHYPGGKNSSKVVIGSWPKDDPRRGFVDGAKWWEFETTGATMWQSDQRKAEEAAQKWSEAQRPAVTREQVREIIMRDVFVSFEEVYPDKAEDSIMALINGGK